MCYPTPIAVSLGKEIKLCAFTGGLASLSGVAILAWLLLVVARSGTAKVPLVSLGAVLQIFALLATSSPWVSGKVQLLLGLWSLSAAAVWFSAQSALLKRTTVFLQAQVAILHDILRYSNERTASLCAEIREVQAAIAVKDNTIRDLQAGVDLEDDTVYDSDATVVGDDESEDVVTALNAIRAECAQNAILLSNARNAHNATMEAKNAKVAQLKVCQRSGILISPTLTCSNFVGRTRGSEESSDGAEEGTGGHREGDCRNEGRRFPPYVSPCIKPTCHVGNKHALRGRNHIS